MALMVVAVGIALEHAIAHLGGRQPPSAFIDLVAGWPLAAVLLMTGAILAGHRR